jgi:hypothetical protein
MKNYGKDNDYYNEGSEEDVKEQIYKDQEKYNILVCGLSLGHKVLCCTISCLPQFPIAALAFDQLLDILIDSLPFYYAWLSTTANKVVK